VVNDGGQQPGSRLRRQLADQFTTCLDRSPRGELVHVWSAVSQLRRTISLGTGLSCFADHIICISERIRLVRECPLRTASDCAIGHATGTLAGASWSEAKYRRASFSRITCFRKLQGARLGHCEKLSTFNYSTSRSSRKYDHRFRCKRRPQIPKCPSRKDLARQNHLPDLLPTRAHWLPLQPLDC
jgi:hypothetical protein